MKNINEYLKPNDIRLDEASTSGWVYANDVYGTNPGTSLDELNNALVKWILINTETKIIAPISKNDLASFTEDSEDRTIEKECKALKIGESYDADGGINIYVRIK